MKKYCPSLLLICFLSVTGSLQATTVIPPTFDELVDRAEVIFQGSVTDVRSQWVGEGGQRHIVTYVTFKVEDAIKGNPGGSYSIRMLGGTVEGHTMEVSDSPKFKKGDRDILFVEHNGQQFIPLVGIMHGRYHIIRGEGGREIMATNSGEPVSDVATLHKEEHAAVSEKAALSPAQFRAAIQEHMHASPGGRQP
jgi:hypothetical protein